MPDLYAALKSAIYFSQMLANGKTIETDDQRIRASGLYEDWTLGSYQVGDIRNVDGTPWECWAAYDNATYPDITPENPQTWANFMRPLHGKSPETALPWHKPVNGTTDIYHVGEYMIYTDGKTYSCNRDTNFSPEEYPSDWTEVTANAS